MCLKSMSSTITMHGLTLPAITAIEKCTFMLLTRRTDGRTNGWTEGNSNSYVLPCYKQVRQQMIRSDQVSNSSEISSMSTLSARRSHQNFSQIMLMTKSKTGFCQQSRGRNSMTRPGQFFLTHSRFHQSILAANFRQI